MNTTQPPVRSIFPSSFIDKARVTKGGDGFAFIPHKPIGSVQFHAAILPDGVGQILSEGKFVFYGYQRGGAVAKFCVQQALRISGYSGSAFNGCVIYNPCLQ